MRSYSRCISLSICFLRFFSTWIECLAVLAHALGRLFCTNRLFLLFLLLETTRQPRNMPHSIAASFHDYLFARISIGVTQETELFVATLDLWGVWQFDSIPSSSRLQ